MTLSAQVVVMPHQAGRRSPASWPTELVRADSPSQFARGIAEAPQRLQSRPRIVPPTLRLIRGDACAEAAGSDPRLTVILAADTVGYTRRMAEDEARMHASCTDVRLNIIEPGIALHGARIVKHTGDGFLAEFPSATRAVWFAITFQDAIRTWNVGTPRDHRLEFRIGINLGDVLVEPHDVFGHNVNIAARLQESAKPGGVLVSHAVAASTRDARLQFEDAGDLTLRHIAEPVRAFHTKLKRRRAARRGAGCVELAVSQGSRSRSPPRSCPKSCGEHIPAADDQANKESRLGCTY
jgi:class 3 adenylate cyclase